MGYYYTISPETVVPPKSCATPKTHTPGSPVKERGHRYYMPEMGRWCSRDPIGEKGGKNLNAFVRNAPQNVVDALGQECFIYHAFPGESPPGGWLGSRNNGMFVPGNIPTVGWERTCGAPNEGYRGKKVGTCTGMIYIRMPEVLGAEEHEQYHAGCLRGYDAAVESLISEMTIPCQCPGPCVDIKRQLITLRLQLILARSHLCDHDFDCENNDNGNLNGVYCRASASDRETIARIQGQIGNLPQIPRNCR